MDLQEISRFISNVGIPGALLIYLVWRFDKFLSFLSEKLATYNQEFSDIGFAIGSAVEELKQIKGTINSLRKK